MRVAKQWIFSVLIIATFSIGVKASEHVEKLYDRYIDQIKFGKADFDEFESLSLINNSVYVDALWDASIIDTAIDIKSSLADISIESDRNTAKLFVLAHYKRDFVTAKKLYNILIKKIGKGSLSNAGLYILWAYKHDLFDSYETLYKKSQENFSDEFNYFFTVNKFVPKSIDEISSLVKENPELSSEVLKPYADTPRLFLFCRHSRDYPCLFVLKTNDGKFLKHGTDIWNIPALAHGRGELKFHTTNGYTPQGVHTMDSVMPEANRQKAFGKYRRVILNFLPKTSGNDYEMEAIPGDGKFSSWWHEANVAREVERAFLRIHGTGIINDEPDLSYYPHITSSGCVTVREGKYPKATYSDQRILLDALMRASDLEENFQNEVNIKGLLYVVEIDDEKRAVTRADLRKYGF